MFWPKGKAMPKYFLCRMVSNFFVSALLALFAGNSLVPVEFSAQKPVKRSRQSWYNVYLHGMANSWFSLQICDISWENYESAKMKICQTGFRPRPHGCAFCITTTPHSWLHEVRYICNKCVLVKCLYQRLYPWAKYWTQPWSVTRWMKDNIGMKSIIVMEMRFYSVLDYHVNERILLIIPAFVLGKYS